MIRLDEEEQELLEAFDADEFQSDMTFARKKFIEQSAEYTFSKNIKIEISEQDFIMLQRKALKEGISYQTLVSNILHEYVSGSKLGFKI